MTPAGEMQATWQGATAGINASVLPDKEQFGGDDTSDAVEHRGTRRHRAGRPARPEGERRAGQHFDSEYIRGYTHANWLTMKEEGMEIVRVRRVGNSNVISLPRQFEAAGYTTGTPVIIEALEDGSLLIRPVATLRTAYRAIARQAIEDNREALDRLAAYDRGEEVVSEQEAPAGPVARE